MPLVRSITAAQWATLSQITVIETNDLRDFVGAGTYRFIRDDENSAVVPTLTAGTIDQATPVVGDTLTVSGGNERAGATYQWEVDTGGGFVDVSGATSATLDTTGEPTGDYRLGVTDGSNVQGEVFTPAVTLAAAPAALVRTYVGNDATKVGDGVATSFTYTALPVGGAGETFFVLETNGRNPNSITVDGVAVDVADIYDSGGAGGTTPTIFHATKASGTTSDVVITFGSAPDSGNGIRLHSYRVENFTGVRDSAAFNNTTATAVTVDVATGGVAIAGAGERGGGVALSFVAGVTADAGLFDVNSADEAMPGSASGLSANATYSVEIAAAGTARSLVVVSLE